MNLAPNKIPEVSVIIPTFNRKSVLPRALESVLGQTYRDFELMVVDDGSEDGSSEILNKYLPDIKIISQKNSGVSAARNAGISASKSKFVTFLDSDDYWKKNKLERQMEIFSKNKDYRIIYTNEIWVRNGKRVNQCNVHKKYSGWIYRRCLPLCIISPSSVLIERDVLNKVGLFDETLPACEDYDLWLRISSRYKIFFLEEELIYKTGGHEDQLSKKYWGMDRFRVISLMKALNLNLNDSDREATVETIKKKCEILINGFKKRNNIEEGARYEKILKQLLK